jgi:hypothetical protein
MNRNGRAGARAHAGALGSLGPWQPGRAVRNQQSMTLVPAANAGVPRPARRLQFCCFRLGTWAGCAGCGLAACLYTHRCARKGGLPLRRPLGATLAATPFVNGLHSTPPRTHANHCPCCLSVAPYVPAADHRQSNIVRMADDSGMSAEAVRSLLRDGACGAGVLAERGRKGRSHAAISQVLILCHCCLCPRSLPLPHRSRP